MISSQVSQAKARKEQASETMKQVELNISVRFQSARATLIDRLNRLKTMEKILQLSKEAMTAAELKYSTGKLSAMELIDAQTVWNNSQLNYRNNIVDYYTALADIEYICPDAVEKESK
jgi:outer membrane protein TolC